MTAVACALPAGCEQPIASRALEAGVPFASSGDDESDLVGPAQPDRGGAPSGVAIVAGCGLAPGLADVLARHAADAFDEVDEIGVARAGTAGDACVATATRALRERPAELRDGIYEESRRRGGHELVWFPEPIGPRECERVATGVHLLSAAVPDAARITVRLARAGHRARGSGWLRAPGSRRLLGRDPGRGLGPARRGARADRLRRDRAHRDRGRHRARRSRRPRSPARCPVCWRRARASSGSGSIAQPRAFLAELSRRGVKAAIFEGVPVA